MLKAIFFCCFLAVTSANVFFLRGRNVTLKPMSVCCEIPELGDPQHLQTCTELQMKGPCYDVQCVFEESGFMIDNSTLNKDVYKEYLKSWAQNNTEWTTGIDRAIKDCIVNNPRQYLDFPCKAYDVFSCTGLALLKKCPEEAWKCEEVS